MTPQEQLDQFEAQARKMWPPTMGPVIATTEVPISWKWTPNRPEGLSRVDDTGLAFSPDAIPAPGAIGLWVRSFGEGDTLTALEMGRTFIPWRSIGGFDCGCGVVIRTHATSEGWVLQFVGDSRAARIDANWCVVG